MESFNSRMVDDKTYIMERVIQLAAELPLNSRTGLGLTNSFLNKLWSDLNHPPLSSLANELRYRAADGSNNNPFHPQLGAAGSPYARTVCPQTMQPIKLPDANTIFDSVMKRKSFRPHPSKISSVLFYLATIITHDLFKTSAKAPQHSGTSSYLDLAPLYGSGAEEQSQIRTYGNGKIKADSFCESRILSMPPGAGVLLIMFNRFHNGAVEQLAIINESGRFTKPSNSRDIDALARYDNDLFETGRLITCGLYVNIILKDYVRTILGLNRTNSSWTLDPRCKLGKNFFNDVPPEVLGNQVSAEFNLVYRWHSCISERDEQWSEMQFQHLFPGKAEGDVTPAQFIRVVAEMESRQPSDPASRSFAGLQRTVEGKYNDEDLAKLFSESVEDCAGAFGANHVPGVLRAVEVLGIERARSWNLATLNEFRQHFRLLPHKSFSDINADPEVAENLRSLYGHPDLVELYPGLILEDEKRGLYPGSGLCTNFTISRAVLSDAVALVKGDRFYSIDYTPKNLTNWGYTAAGYDLGIDYGCVFYKLVLSALPNHFRSDSVFAHYPMVIPFENFTILTELGHANDYSFHRTYSRPHSDLASPNGLCRYGPGNQSDFKSGWEDALTFLALDSAATGNHGRESTMSTDGCGHDSVSRDLLRRILYPCNWQHEVQTCYEHVASKLLQRSTATIGGRRQINLVNVISSLAPTYFVSMVFSLPLKIRHNRWGLFTGTELFSLLTALSTCLFHDNVDPVELFPLRLVTRDLTQKLGKLLELNLRLVKKTSMLYGAWNLFRRHESSPYHGLHIIRALLESKIPVKNLIWMHILPTAAAMVTNQSQLFSQCMDYYLSEEGKAYLPEIHRLSHANTQEADGVLLHYFLEGSRLGCDMGVPPERLTKSVLPNDEGFQNQPCQPAFGSLAHASRDPEVFPTPHKVILNRKLEVYESSADAPYQHLIEPLNRIAMTAMLKSVGQLKNLRRVPGKHGEIKKVMDAHGFQRYMTVDESRYFPLPTSMKVQWD